MTEYQDVPTLPELERRKLAKIVDSNKQGTFYRTTPEGQALIDRIMAENAEHLRQHPEEGVARAYERVRAFQAEKAADKKK